MSRHRGYSGLLLSQLLELLGTPLAEERVWALCYGICKSFVDTFNKDTSGDVDGSPLRNTRVVFELDTIYLHKEGNVIIFFPDWLDAHADSATASQQMKSFGKLLSTFLGSTIFEFGTRPVVDDLENLVRHMIQGKLKDTQEHWVHLVSDRCVRHASSLTSRSVGAPSEYYRRLCKAVADEALEVMSFMDVLKEEFALLCSNDALYTLQLLQARATVRRWLQVMSEIRQGAKCDQNVASSPSASAVPAKRICASHRRPPEPPSPSSAKLARQLPIKSDEQQSNLSETVHVGKPVFFSTPTATCKPARKVLRPPQRLVDQVTSWMLEVEAHATSKSPDSFCASASVAKSGILTPGEWAELDSHGSDRDVSWSPWRQQSTPSSAAGDWFREVTRIRRVLMEIELDASMEDESLYDALQNGKVCFCCRHTKFSLFNRWGVGCDVCQKRVCDACVVQAKPRDLGMSSSDATEIRHGNGVFKQIRRVFKQKPGGRENDEDLKLCKDCRDFVQRFYWRYRTSSFHVDKHIINAKK